jgi:protein tyrosine phosphatase (PTP) superfamily phosphohydrolase (DUF442 family)
VVASDADHLSMPLMATTLPLPALALPTPVVALRRLGVLMAKLVLLVALFLIVGNALIVAAWQWESRTTPAASVSVDVTNFRVVDDHVWRGAAPSAQTYRELAAAGATTIVDLRAEDDIHIDTALLDELGLDLVRIPMRDGQAPTERQVARFLAAVAGSAGPVYVHCGAGVGRTGTMVAAYLVDTGQANGLGALRGNLGVGPPSLEQLAFAASLDGGEVGAPPAALVAASRVLDAPRRIWTRLSG